ncbi:hypothetical protein PINS_up012094 [Pythium insidiosum]|nr:hypothetical protein PINS_up012094 [Pythium insidiosum]
MRALTFQRDPRATSASSSFLDLRFRVDDRVILSAESLDGKRLLVHITRGRIALLSQDLITIESYQNIPSIVTSGRSVVGDQYTWRLDRDSIFTGLSRAKENLVRLFVGPVPETVKTGTSSVLRGDLFGGLSQSAPAIASQVSNALLNVGDLRRRKLIVHLAKPRFRSLRLTELLFQRVPDKDDAFDPQVVAAKQLLHEFSSLNIDQQQAVVKVLNALDYALILGMPGTGKTSTIAFTVRVLLYLGFSVLITSYTHSAVDNLLLKLVEYDDIPMLRIGNPSQVHPRLAPYTLDMLLGDTTMSVRSVDAQFRGAMLVGSTCLGVNSHVLFSKRRFDFCIVDEATQTTEPVVLGPLRCADTFVLVGDHYQLPPLVANHQAKKEGMDVSLFRRLSEAHPEAIQQLSYQYRMNSDIMALANRLIYSDKLKCGSFGVANNQLELVFAEDVERMARGLWPLTVLGSEHGVQFLNTDIVPGVSETKAQRNGITIEGTRGAKKMENVVEAQIIAGLVSLLIIGGVPLDEIAVISPFRSQVALIWQELRQRGVDLTCGVEVSTIDKYQGKDKAVVLVSFVRSNSENHVGELLTDWRRINVALTRAKQKLLLIGSKRTLRSGSALFQVLMQLIDERRWEFELKKDAMQVLTGVSDRIQPQLTQQLSLSIRRSQLEPEPESEADFQRRDVQVSVLQRGTSSDAGQDIESLVPNAVPIMTKPFGRRATTMKKPFDRL